MLARTIKLGLAAGLLLGTGRAAVPQSQFARMREIGVYAKYDRFKNRTVFTTDEIVLHGSLEALPPYGRVLTVSAMKQCKGYRDCKTKSILLQFAAQSSSWRFLGYHSLTFIADGKRISLETTYDGDVIRGNWVLEQMFASLKANQFKELANAKSVEGKLGMIEFSISYDERERWRAVVNPELMKGILSGNKQ